MNALFICLASRTNETKGTIKCRITISGERLQFSMGISIDLKNWNQKKQQVSSKEANYQSLNLSLSEHKNRINRHWHLQEFTNIEELKVLLFEEETRQKTVNEVITSFLEKKKLLIDKPKNVNGIIIETFNTIAKTLKHLSEFVEKNTLCINLNRQFMDKYHEHLIKKGFQNDYTVKCLQVVRTLLNHAMEIGEIKANPLVFYNLPKRQGTELVYLTTEEKAKLEAHKFTADKLTKVQDLFIFQCYTGFAYVDMCNFSEKHIFEHNGQQYIKIHRQKTDQETIVPFFPKAKEIWERCQEQLPIISSQNYNAYLKEIAGILGINEKLTTHVARKTFAMLSLNAGLSMEVVSRCLGHSDIRTTQKVYAKVNETRILSEFEDINF